MTPGPPQIDFHAVAKSYGGAVALAPTTLSFAAGTVTALVGSSGCGKSTVLRLILGLLTPTGGTVHVAGTPVTPASTRAIRHQTGYVVQDGGLFPHLTARDNVTLLAEHLGHKRNSLAPRLEELAALVRLPAELLGRYPAQLSGGQRQRVGVMRALYLDPPLLLLDEPMGALDPLVRAELQADLAALFARLKKTVLLVTHDLREAERLAGRIVLMDAGRVVQEGTLAEMRSTPSSPFVTRFLAAFTEGPRP